MKYPKCDKCGKPIRGKSKYIKVYGFLYLVHQSYNETTGEC